MTTHLKALFEHINNLQKLVLFYTAIRKHVPKKDSMQLYSRKGSTNFRYSILNIRMTLAELLSTKNRIEGVWREKGKVLI